MTDTTQPPAETLAEAVHCALKDAAAIATAEADRLAKEMPMGSRSEGTARAIAADITRLADAALTRRAGDDAIPAGMKPWHGGDAAPADWDLGAVLGADGKLYEPDGWDGEIDWRHNLGKRGIGIDIIAYTPKPPAGGDAGAVDREADREKIARVLFDQRQTAHDFDDAADATPESDAGTLYSIVHDDADAVIAALALPAPVVEGDAYAALVKAAYLEGLHTGPDGGQDDHEEEFWMESRAFAALSEGRSHG